MNKSSTFFYFISFLEGAAVMAAELFGAKMLAPYFGTSLYVWSSVLGVTLGGLAAGYFTGGVVSARKHNERNLYYVLLASSIFLIMMPVLAKEVVVHTAGSALLASILTAAIIFLFPPVFFMGMVSPLIVECIANPDATSRMQLNENASEVFMDKPRASGRTAGTVYAISTVGGILSTFFMGFYCIPMYGLTKPAIITGILMGVIPFVKLVSTKNNSSFIFIPLVIGAVFFSFRDAQIEAGSGVEILYSNEGLLGQIIVADYPLYDGSKKIEGSQRMLFVNRSTQTLVTMKNDEKSFFEYVHLISRETEMATNQEALVLGLGGGSVANILTEKSMKVDAVELDVRMAEVAKKYFNLSAKVTVHVDDARHYLRNLVADTTQHKKYEVIVLDAFVGEVNPHHLFTQEFFNELISVLADDGVFFINGNGYWKGDAGRGMRSVCKTLLNSGFNVEIVPTREEEDYRNLVFIAQKSKTDVGVVTSAGIQDLTLQEDLILVDEKPQLEILNAEANKRWREACMKYFLHGYYSKQDMLLFK